MEKCVTNRDVIKILQHNVKFVNKNVILKKNREGKSLCGGSNLIYLMWFDSQRTELEGRQ